MELEDYLREISKIPRLSREEEKKLGERVKYDPAARNRFIASNLGLVVWRAKKYSRSGDMRDLIQQGNIGLMEAVDRYSPLQFDNTFSTYGVYWIDKEIIEYLNIKKSDSLPEELQTLKKRLFNEVESYFQTHGREPDDSYLSRVSLQKMGKKYSEAEIREYRTLFYQHAMVSLDETEYSDGENTVGETIGHNPESSLLDHIQGESLRDTVEKTISSLDIDDIEKGILKGRLLEELEIDELSQRFSLTKRQVQGRYEKHMKLLKSALIKHPMFDHYAEERNNSSK